MRKVKFDWNKEEFDRSIWRDKLHIVANSTKLEPDLRALNHRFAQAASDKLAGFDRFALQRDKSS